MATTRARSAALALALALLACAAPTPASAEWKFCAPEGGHCHCFGEMRFGHPGTDAHHAEAGKFFDDHPEVRLWNKIQTKGHQVECGQALFGGEGEDPFPETLLGDAAGKFCQCNTPEERVWKHCADAGGVCQCAAENANANANANAAAADADADLGEENNENDAENAESGENAQEEEKQQPRRHASLVRATDDSVGRYKLNAVDP
jgi:hypothetical protein